MGTAYFKSPLKPVKYIPSHVILLLPGCKADCCSLGTALFGKCTENLPGMFYDTNWGEALLGRDAQQV